MKKDLSIQNFIEGLKARKVIFNLQNDQLSVKAPKGALTPEDVAFLKDNKTEILKILKQLPLLPGQRGLWFLQQMDPHSTAYNISGAFKVSYKLETAKIKEAILMLQERHQILRAAISAGNFQIKEAFQDIYSERMISEEELIPILNQNSQISFDLELGPLIKIHHLKFKDTSASAIQLVIHHLIADAWSCSNIVRDLIDYIQNGKFQPEQVLQHQDFVESFQAYERSPAYLLDKDYWDKRLGDLDSTLTFPYDGKNSLSSVGVVKATINGAHLTSWLRGLEMTPFQYFLSLYQIILSRLTLQEKVSVGYPVAGRFSTEEASACSSTINSLPLFSVINHAQSLQNFLVKNKKLIEEDFGHQRFPLEEMVKQKSKKLGHAPLFQNFFVFQNTPLAHQVLNEQGIHLIEQDATTAKFDTTLTVVPNGQDFELSLEYKANLISSSFAESVMQALIYLLKSAQKEAITHIGELPLIESTEMIRGGQAVKASDESILHMFLKMVEKSPASVAIEHGPHSLTFAELHAESNRWANNLPLLNKKGLVALRLSRGPEQVIAILACFKLGLGYIPIDPETPESRVREVLKVAEPLLLVDDERLARITTTVPAIRFQEFKKRDSSGTFPLSHSEEMAYVIFTSGSTGIPQGVPITHHQIVRLIDNTNPFLNFSSSDKWSLFHSYAFDFSVWEIFVPLATGGTIVIVPQETARNPEAFHQLIVDHKITFLNQTPTAFHALLPLFTKNDDAHSLKTILLSGEAMEVNHLTPWFEKFKNAPVRIINSYGITETTVLVTLREITSDDLTRSQRSPIGLPMGDLGCFILDQAFNTVPVGFPGELCVWGPSLSSGYLKNPTLTEQRFVTHPTHNQRLYRSGDLVRLLPGPELEYIGRKDRQVKIRGYRIELGDIENSLLTLPSISEVVVDVIQDSLIAHVVLLAGQEFDEQNLRKEAKKCLPPHMVPSRWNHLLKIPLNLNGKVDRKALVISHKLNVSKEKKSNLLPTVKEVFEEFLGREIEPELGFFDLGAHSMMMIEIHRRLQENLKITFPLSVFFEYPNPLELSHYLETRIGIRKEEKFSDSVSLENISREDIAIIGMACRFPDAKNIDEFWSNLNRGKESIKNISSKSEMPQNYVPYSGHMEGIDLFDAEAFGISPKEAELLDPQQRIILETAYEALSDAGLGNLKQAKSVGTFVSSSLSRYLLFHLLPQVEAGNLTTPLGALLGTDKDYLATKLAFKLNLTGPAVNVQTACSSSLVAVNEAIKSLHHNECRAALAGGVSLLLEKEGYVYEDGGIGSRDGKCRPFDHAASGTVAGSGAGIVVLKKLSEALKDQDHIYAVIKGIAVNNDGSHKVGFTAPSHRGEVDVMKLALHKAGIKPEEVTFIETHGTATAIGDEIEFSAMNEVYQGNTKYLGALKANIGHLDAASGIAGLIKTALVLKHSSIPPQINFEKFPAHIKTDSFRVNKEKVLLSDKTIAAVSSFGMGGTNAHAILSSLDKHLRTEKKTKRPSFNHRSYWIPKSSRVAAKVTREQHLSSPVWEQIILEPSHESMAYEHLQIQENTRWSDIKNELLKLSELHKHHKIAILISGWLGQRIINTENGHPQLSEILALIRVAKDEYPHLDLRLLDSDLNDLQVKEILPAIFSQPQSELANRHGQFYAKKWNKLEAPPVTVHKGKTFLVTGGTGGIGKLVIQHLKKNYEAHIILLVRTHDSSLAFDQYVCDITNKMNVEETMIKLKTEHGKIDFVLHLAGKAIGKMLQTVSQEEIDEVWRPKTEAFLNLISTFKIQDQTRFILFSALNAELGGFGQFAYSRANEALNQSALKYAAEGWKVSSILWSGWSQTGMKKNHAPHPDSELTVSDALHLLDQTLNIARPIIAVTPYPMLMMKEKILETQDQKSSPQNIGLNKQELTSYFTKLWQVHLGVETINPDDSFFDLGGDSLLALTLKKEIEDDLKISLPISTLVKSHTISILTQEILNLCPELKALTPLTRTPGKSNLYFVHAVMGTIFPFIELAQLLEGHINFSAFQSLALTHEQFLPDLESLAASYVKELTTQCPHGPIHLGGWSFGGLVAYEMAVQLKAQGRTVEKLFIVDMSCEWDQGKVSSLSEDRIREQFLLDVSKLFGRELDENSQEVKPLFKVFEHHVQLTRDYLKRLSEKNYILPETNVELIKALQGMGQASDPHLGWNAHVQNLIMTSLEADHYSILKKPIVNQVAKLMKGTNEG